MPSITNWKEAEAARILADDQPLYDLYKLDHRARLDAHRKMGVVRCFVATIGEAVAPGGRVSDHPDDNEYPGRSHPRGGSRRS